MLKRDTIFVTFTQAGVWAFFPSYSRKTYIFVFTFVAKENEREAEKVNEECRGKAFRCYTIFSRLLLAWSLTSQSSSSYSTSTPCWVSSIFQHIQEQCLIHPFTKLELLALSASYPYPRICFAVFFFFCFHRTDNRPKRHASRVSSHELGNWKYEYS